MFLKSFSVLCVAVVMLVSVGCSGANFTVVRDGSGTHTGTVLGMRSVADVRALAPTDKLSWLEYCTPEVTRSLKVFSSTDYINCELENQILPVAKNSVSTGYVAGIAGPVLQAGAIVGGAALIGDGIRHSGSTTTNNNNTTGGSSNATNKNRNTNTNTNSGGSCQGNCE